ncbi:MAG: GTPase HflX, partial [Lachnospiraceae bacterium]|nr:GTPase HflX [Lachnospiraceae bacterium]
SKNSVPVVAIVGYTNAGKSTLLNYLTGAGILEADMLFATLDPTTRNMKLESGQEILLTDTVGFIRKLPHHLIDAFRSTLEEAKYADVILHVIDASDSEADEKMHVVYKTLEKLGVKDKPVVAVFNKQDKLLSPESVKDLRADRSVRISAKTGAGVDKLLGAVEELLREKKSYFEGTVPYTDAGLLQQVRKSGQLIAEEYREDGIFVKAYVPADVYGRLCK